MTRFLSSLELHYTSRFFENSVEMHSLFKNKTKPQLTKQKKKSLKKNQLPLHHKHQSSFKPISCRCASRTHKNLF